MKDFRSPGGLGKEIETALLAFFFTELEGTLEEFYSTFKIVAVTPRQRQEFQRGIRRLIRKEIIEPIGYLGYWMNYRVTENALTKGLTNKRRGSYGITDLGHSDRVKPRRARRSLEGLR